MTGSNASEAVGGRRDQPGDRLALDPVRAEGRRLSAEAELAGLRLRLIGSLGVREHCAATEQVLAAVGRELAHDIDYVAAARDERAIVDFFKRLGYRPDPAVAYSREYGIQRLIYHHPSAPIKVDVFLDILHMSHTIDFRNRLPEGEATVTLADLLLAKLQIHAITEKDLQDLTAILAVHGLGTGDRETIDVRYVSHLLGQDWGLYFTSVGNLDRLRHWLDDRPSVPATIRAATANAVERMVAEIESAPRSLRWRARSAVGPKVRWYEDVEEVDR